MGEKENKTGILTNMTDGGEGAYGCTPSVETKKKISETKTGTKLSTLIKNRMRTARIGKTHSDETKIKISQAHKNKVHHNDKKVITPLGDFDSITEAAKAHKTSRKVIKRKILNTSEKNYVFKNQKIL